MLIRKMFFYLSKDDFIINNRWFAIFKLKFKNKKNDCAYDNWIGSKKKKIPLKILKKKNRDA